MTLLEEFSNTFTTILGNFFPFYNPIDDEEEEGPINEVEPIIIIGSLYVFYLVADFYFPAIIPGGK